MESFGTKELEEVLDMGFAFHQTYNSFVDGGKNLNNLLVLAMPLIAKVKAGIDGAKQITKEIMDLSQPEYDRLVEKYGADIRNPGVIKMVHGFIEVAQGIYEMRAANVKVKPITLPPAVAEAA